ncbi:MAG: glycosyltransferase [Minisyncoccia bacterium]
MKISVVMPVYNGEKYLKEAIQSVLNQTERDFELLIINDGSTDNSEAIAKSFNDNRIKVINKKHSGLIDTLNLGFDTAHGDYIARMDADDISETNRFQKQLEVMEKENVLICGTRAKTINENGEVVGEFIYPPLSWSGIKYYTLRGNPFIHPTVIIRKDVLKKVGNLHKFFRHAEDYELWTRIVYKYKAINLSDQLLRYRIHGNQVTKKNNIEMRLRGILIRLLCLYRFVLRF